ncbi:MAG TPA: hypothetical protein PKZ64_14130 [Spirochaetota bacterium]|nr:hypothetical protein [Spirochaetota bacterium]HPR73864.1 hypothetical protein [Bacteroidales bacterium]
MFRAIGRFLNGFNYKYIKPWFFSSDDPGRIKAPYVISFVFLGLTVWAIVIHITIKMWQFHEIIQLWNRDGIESLPYIETLAKIDMSLIPLISVLIGTAGLFIGLYNWGKKKSDAQPVGVETGEGTGAGDGAIKPDEI